MGRKTQSPSRAMYGLENNKDFQTNQGVRTCAPTCALKSRKTRFRKGKSHPADGAEPLHRYRVCRFIVTVGTRERDIGHTLTGRRRWRWCTVSWDGVISIGELGHCSLNSVPCMLLFGVLVLRILRIPVNCTSEDALAAICDLGVLKLSRLVFPAVDTSVVTLG